MCVRPQSSLPPEFIIRGHVLSSGGVSKLKVLHRAINCGKSWFSQCDIPVQRSQHSNINLGRLGFKSFGKTTNFDWIKLLIYIIILLQHRMFFRCLHDFS